MPSWEIKHVPEYTNSYKIGIRIHIITCKTLSVHLKNAEASKCVSKSMSRPIRLYVTHYYKQLIETLGIFVCIWIPQQTHQTRDYMKWEEHLVQTWEPNECVCQIVTSMLTYFALTWKVNVKNMLITFYAHLPLKHHILHSNIYLFILTLFW